MTTRSEIVSVISFIGEEFVQNTMRVVAYIRKEVVVHVSSQLGWCGIVAGVEVSSVSGHRTQGRNFDLRPLPSNLTYKLNRRVIYLESKVT